MELNEIMRLIWQGLINIPQDAPERGEAIRAYGALESRLDYTPPETLLTPRPGGYTVVEFTGGTTRLFPQTYGDWVNLAEDIKDKVDTPEYAEINSKLGIIGGFEEGDAEEAKRWLIEKARELGIS